MFSIFRRVTGSSNCSLIGALVSDVLSFQLWEGLNMMGFTGMEISAMGDDALEIPLNLSGD